MTNLMKKLMVKIAANHHAVRANPIINKELSPDVASSSSLSLSSSTCYCSNEEIYDENNLEWATQFNPLFDCNFATIMQHEEEARMVSNRMSMAGGRRRRGSSLLTKSISEQPRVASPRFVSKLEFESCWEVQEHYFAKFESVELLSRKGNSCLYLIKHPHESQYKVLRLIQCSTVKEAQLLNVHFERIIHLPNYQDFFVHIYDSSIVGEKTVAVEMEYIEMGNLQSLMDEEDVQLSDEMIAQVISQITQAIQFLNDNKGLHHGNIRPHNIFIKTFNDDYDLIEVVLSDFGWKEQSFASNSEKRFTLPKAYNSFNDKKLIMDVYHLGVTLYQICSRDKELILSQLYEQNEEETLINEALYSRLSKCIQHRRDLVELILRMVSKSYDNVPSTRDIITSQSIVSLS